MFSAPSPTLPNMPAAPAPPPMFGQQPTAQKKPTNTNSGQKIDPTILGQSPTGTGQKTLLGQ